MRPKQWIKNFIIFAGLIFSKNIFDMTMLARTILAFLLFCLLSGSVYITNDLIDLEKDRNHPRKASRPIASERLTSLQAEIWVVILILVALGVSFSLSLFFGLIAASFLLLNFAYTLLVKRIVILDVMTIAISFVLRALAGTAVIEVSLSPWLLICTILLALFLGLNKRRHEIVVLGENASRHRDVLAHYSPYLLDQMISVVGASTVIAYSLYTFTSSTAHRARYLTFTIPFVLYGIFRYQYLVHQKNQGGSPEEILLRDIPLLINIFLWIIAIGVILYLE